MIISQNVFKKIVIVLVFCLIGVAIFLFVKEREFNNSQQSIAIYQKELIPKTIPQVSSTVYKQQNLPKEFSFIFTGDVVPGRMVNYMMTQRNDFVYPFASTSAFLKNADLTVINLETPLINNCPVTSKGMIFCGNPKFIAGIKSAGVDVATLANNHISNYGQDGIKKTVKLLEENGIETVGTGNILYKKTKTMVVAFVNYNDISPRDSYTVVVNESKIKDDIVKAKKNSDYVVAIFHWGKEYSYIPLSDPPVALHNPTKIAHLAIDSGADLVVGNNPHIVQGYEKYKDKYIFYALGNFIFDQMWSEQTRQGAILRIKLQDKKLSSFDFHPIKIYDYSQPRFLEGKEKQQVLDKIKEIKNL